MGDFVETSTLSEALDRALQRLTTAGARITCLAISPKPLIVVETPGSESHELVDDALFLGEGLAYLKIDAALRIKQRPDRCPVLFRCVEYERLPVILATGCDVEPSNSILHAAGSPSKAPEYGGKRKVLMILDGWALERCVRTVSRSIGEEELVRLCKLYPCQITTVDGDFLELRREPSTIYLHPDYSMWIPGDPWQALMTVIVFGPAKDNLLPKTSELIGRCSQKKWTILIDSSTAEEATFRVVGLLRGLRLIPA